MDKIKLITDSTSDIPDEILEKYQIDMLHIPITIDGEGYFERESFTLEEFYSLLENSKEIPKTSRILEPVYVEAFESAYEKGYTHVFNVTINSGGSGTNASAHNARAMFYEKHPEAEGSFAIKIVDSKTYSQAHGQPLMQASEKILAGATAAEIDAFLTQWFDCADAYLGCYTLEYAKRSGRINAAAAFVGEMLGMRPIIRLVDGKTETIAKVRGNGALVDKLFELYQEVRPSKDSTVVVMYGRNKEEGQKLHKLIEKDTGRNIELYPLGACILINAGPDSCAFVVEGKNRSL